MYIDRIKYLLQKYYDKSISDQERRDLYKYIDNLDQKSLEDLMFENFSENFQDDNLVEYDSETKWLELKNKIQLKQPPRRFKIIKWKTAISIAATILVISMISLYLFYGKKSGDYISGSNSIEDVIPAGNKAILTLTNGDKVNLDTLSIGLIIKDEYTLIEKLADGNIRYIANQELESPKKFNVIETPVGGTYQVTLPDGSRVVLNALSKLTYPLNFSGDSRDVDLEGEAFFDIAHDKSKPFFVHLNSTNKIKVLGTKFNVNAYHAGNETTSVIEGAVNVFNVDKSVILSKNQILEVRRGVYKSYDDKNVIDNIAWVDGYFCKESILLTDLLAQISRWYGIKIDNKQGLNNEFVLSIKRDISLKDLMKIIELTDEIKFEFKNNVLYVSKVN